MKLTLDIPLQNEEDKAEYGWEIDPSFLNLISLRANEKTGKREPGDELDYIQNVILSLDEYLWWKNHV